MWIFCDDQGIHPAKPKTLKAEIFPMDDITADQVAGWVAELIHNGLLREYTVNSETYWIVTGWNKHQKIDKPSAKYPPPFDESSPNTPRALDDSSPPESNGVEGKETTPATVTRTSVSKRQPTAGAVSEGQPQHPRPEASAPSLDALRTGPPVGTADHDASGELWGCLAANGCRGTAQHPAVVEMARAGVTVAQLKAAIAEARKTREGQLNPAYLAAIVERMRAERPRDPAALAWATSDAACDAKARELLITPRPGEGYPELRGRIRERIAEAARESVH